MIRFYKDKSKKKEWRWEIKAPNNETVAASSEGFSTKYAAVNNLLMTHTMISTELARIAKEKASIIWEDEEEDAPDS